MASRIVEVPIRREFDVGKLASLPDEATLDAADEDGAFDGNRAFTDLRGMTWADLAETLEIERAVLARLEAAIDLAAEYEAVSDELLLEYGAEGLWGLDPGVASAVIALSALGAIPVASCNGGVLGGDHQEEYPLAAFYLSPTAARHVVHLVDVASIGLLIDNDGRVQVYDQSYRGLVRFAELALAHGR